MSKVKGKCVFRRNGASLGEVSVKYLKSREKFAVRLKNGDYCSVSSVSSVRYDKKYLYDLFLFDFSYASILSACSCESDIDAFEYYEGVGSAYDVSYSDWEKLSLIQYLFVLNWKVCCEIIKAEHLYRLGRLESPWVVLKERSRGQGCGRRGCGGVVGRISRSEYNEAKDNVWVSYKYRDEAWFVEYCRRICVYEGKEFDLRAVLDFFRKKSR